MSKKPIVRPTYIIESVDRALRLLQAVRDQGGMRLTDAAAEIGCAESTAHRLLAMLVYHGFVEQDDQRRYVPGPSMGMPPSPRADTRSLRDLCLPALRVIAAETGETANLVVLDGVRVRVVGTVESTRLLRAGNRQGHVPLARYAGGGKALLAELPPADLDALYAADGEDPLSAVELGALRAELEAVRVRGYAVAVDEVELGLTAVARVVHAALAAVAAVVVALPTVRLRERMGAGLVDSLRTAAAAVETRLAAE